MRIPQEKFEEISQANDIIDVVSGYILVKKRGKTFIALCPFHPDKNPSLHISQEKQVYHCFSCKASGNVYQFVQNFEKITFHEAVQKLAERAGIVLKYNAKDPDLSNEISKLFEINKAAAKYFQNNLLNLHSSEKDFVFKYLDKRKIDRKVIDRFGIGYSGKSRDGLLNYFLEEGIFRPDEIEKAGLILRSEKENKYFDRFRGRLMFPVFNENNKVVAFGGRKLFEDDQGGKYINSPESKIYYKGKTLYGLNFAKDSIRFNDFVILVEGYMDLISLSKHGIENTIASSGTALSEEQVKLISRYTKNIYILFDSDFAGVKAAKRGIELILEAGLDLSVITLPDGEDPDSFISKNGKDEFEKFVNSRKSVINFISWLYEKENKLESVNDKTDFVKEIIGYIGKIPDKIKKAFYVKEIARHHSLYESDLRDELEKATKTKQSKNYPRTSVSIPETNSKNGSGEYQKISNEERDLIELFINGNEEVVAYIENNLEINFIKNKIATEVIQYFLNEYIDHGKIELTKALNELESDNAKVLVTTIAIQQHEVSHFENDSRDRLLNASVKPVYNLRFAKDIIRKFRIKELEERRERIKKDSSQINEAFEITKQLNELKKGNPK